MNLKNFKVDVFLEELTFSEYLEKVKNDKKIARNAFERLYDMIISCGIKKYKDAKKEIIQYNFFSDPDIAGNDAVFGVDLWIMKLVSVLKAAAAGFGPEKRLLLLHGPVGSAKSTIARRIKKGLEEYVKKPEGALYRFEWDTKGDSDVEEILGEKTYPCPMREDPLHLVLKNQREEISKELKIEISGDLCPACSVIFQKLAEKYEGDFEKIMAHIKIKRMIFDEKRRVGIGTFQPKDEKNQDSTELTGDINYRKIAKYGSDSDPRAFNFDGEFCVGNRGLVEFVEVLKLDTAFLYDLLGATQEHAIKPKKFAQTEIDEVIIGHTNEPEYQKLRSNEFMEALRDRTIKVDIPYVTRLSDEIKIYQKDFNPQKIKGKHIAPHTIEIAAMWAVLTRLEDPKKAQLTVMQKLKLYNGKTLPGFTEDNIKELRKESEREGFEGISPRYVQDKISNALANINEACLNPFAVLNELEGGLRHQSLINSKDQQAKYKNLIAVVKEEFDDIVKNEVQRAICADEEAIKKLCGNYIDNIKAYTQKEKVKNKYTGKDENPDERLMRSLEEKIDIADSRKDDFRRELMNYIGALAIDGKAFDYKSNERLMKALELKLFNDQKDAIKITSIISNQVIDKKEQEKIDVIKRRMKERFGYCDVCATDVLSYVASIFARGDKK